MINFDYIPPEDLKKQLSEGEAEFTILDSSDGFTKEGKEKTEFRVGIVDSNGVSGTIPVHAVKDAPWIFLNIFKSIGCANLYKAGGCRKEDVLGKEGKCILKRNGNFINVAKWLPYDSSIMRKNTVKETERFDDDIPF